MVKPTGRCQRRFLLEDGPGDQMEIYGQLLALRILARGGPKTVARLCLHEPSAVAAVLAKDDCPSAEKIAQFAAPRLARLEELETVKPQVLSANLDLLSKAVPLSAIDNDLIALHVTGRNYRPLYETLSFCGDLSDHSLVRLLGIALKTDHGTIAKALAANEILRSSGLVILSDEIESFWSKLQVLDRLCNALLSHHKNLDSLLSALVRKSREAVHQLGDFETLRDMLQILVPYLRNARNACIKGCNILLYGPPGVGKTEAVRTIAHELNFTLYEIAIGDKDGDPMDGAARLQHYRFAQKLLDTEKNAIILFDEVEDVFPIESTFLPLFVSDAGLGKNKAWTNRILEENPTPAFWVANRVHQVDPAFLRRFDFVLEMKPLPRSVRHRLFVKCFQGVPVRDEWIARLADNPNLTPADIVRARKVLALADVAASTSLERQIELILKGHLAARSVRNDGPAYPKPDEFHHDILNTSMDTDFLAGCLGSSSRARVCLYGPPGAGKTLYAHRLAELLEKPIIVKRASDILSMWVGQTEQNIAGMFQEACAEEAILLLDEADSFLQDRRGAKHSWEITQVNELLTQLECFQGIFICATNFMDSLDTAVLRRFPIKIRFDYLTLEQREKCFIRTLRAGGCSIAGELSEHVRASLARLNNLTPGDFAAISERWRTLSIVPTPGSLLRELQQESRLKPESKRSSIGFMAQDPIGSAGNERLRYLSLARI
jgi:SpoVK/Ycf46/Vps4 family AAA+-type ATPase